MNRINKEKYFEKKDKILEFIRIHEYEYQEMTGIMMMLIYKDIVLELPWNSIPRLLSQILSRFGVYHNGKDSYVEMFKLLEKYSFLQGNCCEIGAGMYPRLAELVAPQLKLRKGTLTIYEPNIILTKLENAKIVRERFKKDTNIDQVDTIYGLFPCKASIVIAEKAFEEDKNLMLAFCACDHSTKEHPKWLGKYWAEDFCMDYREKYGNEAEIINWPSPVGIDLPIMIRKKRKTK